MKKVYIIMMGLMVCMGLTTQSCSSGDDDGLEENSQSFNDMGAVGSYSGHWLVDGERGCDCVMIYNGYTIVFSEMPNATILKRLGFRDLAQLCQSGLSSPGKQDGGYTQDQNGHMQGDPFVVQPIQTGYSEKSVYFTNTSYYATAFNSYDSEFAVPSILSYPFVIKDGDKTWQFSLMFSGENYGIYNVEQSSRVIRFFLKEILVTPPGGERETRTCNPMWELTFISND